MGRWLAHGLTTALLAVIVVSSLVWAQSNVIIQRWVLPGTNTEGMSAHASATELGIRYPLGDVIARGGYKVAYAFAHSDYVDVGVTNANMPIAGTVNRATSVAGPTTVGITSQPAPYAGSVVGVALGASAALTRGAAHAEVTLWSATPGITGTGFVAVLGSDSPDQTQFVSATQADGETTFTTSNAIGCRITTDATLTPLTVELTCTVIVRY